MDEENPQHISLNDAWPEWRDPGLKHSEAPDSERCSGPRKFFFCLLKRNGFILLLFLFALLNKFCFVLFTVCLPGDTSWTFLLRGSTD